MSKDKYLLEAKKIVKSYPLGVSKVEVLKGVDFSVAPGEFVAITGASGSGKSTLLHILGALDKPDQGLVNFQGKDIAKISSGQMNKFRNHKIGFVFQFYYLLDELNVAENVYLPAMALSSLLGWFKIRSEAKKRAHQMLEKFGLGHRVKHKPYQLSGGERQRVAIARALMNEPVLLLADEPTGNLDSETGNGILNVFEELNKAGQTIIMVTHDDRIAQRASRIVVLADGKVKG